MEHARNSVRALSQSRIRVLVCALFPTVLYGACERSKVTTTSEATSTAIAASAPHPLAMSPQSPAVSYSVSGPTESAPLSCSPDTIQRGDTATLRMKTPHGGYLSVTRADGTVYFIVYPQLGDPKRKHSLIPSDVFKTVRILRLPQDLRAAPRVYGRDTILEPVFSSRGTYVFEMGENLESDHGVAPVMCSLTYVETGK